MSFWAIAYYGRVATSFAQVMSLRVVPNSPVVDEVLFGGSSLPSSFRRGRLLPKWLLLSREVDRTTSSRVHHDSREQVPEEEEYPSVTSRTARVAEAESSDSHSEPRSESRLKQLGEYLGLSLIQREHAVGELEEPRMLSSQELQDMFPGSLLAQRLQEQAAEQYHNYNHCAAARTPHGPFTSPTLPSLEPSSSSATLACFS